MDVVFILKYSTVLRQVWLQVEHFEMFRSRYSPAWSGMGSRKAEHYLFLRRQ